MSLQGHFSARTDDSFKACDGLISTTGETRSVAVFRSGFDLKGGFGPRAGAERPSHCRKSGWRRMAAPARSKQISLDQHGKSATQLLLHQPRDAVFPIAPAARVERSMPHGRQ